MIGSRIATEIAYSFVRSTYENTDELVKRSSVSVHLASPGTTSLSWCLKPFDVMSIAEANISYESAIPV